MRRFVWVILAMCAGFGSAQAQLPFYTDDVNVTERGIWHLEVFDELDGLQREQSPNLRQNTLNYKLNVGLPHNLEIDVDSPYLGIFRALGTLPQSSNGVGDTNLGIKWRIHGEGGHSRTPAFATTFYFEFPTGDTTQGLGSGLNDYWLNGIVQKHLAPKLRLTGNVGILFAGNTSTGELGIQTTRGRVYTFGCSLVTDIGAKWSFGAEVYGGFTNRIELSRSQVQILGGGTYALRKNLSLTFGLLGGKYIGSPRIGGQLGFAVDLPVHLRGTGAALNP